MHVSGGHDGFADRCDVSKEYDDSMPVPLQTPIQAMSLPDPALRELRVRIAA